MNIEQARKKLEALKKNHSADEEKIATLEVLFKDSNIFFNIDMETAFGILEFLGVEEGKIYDEYKELISPNAYRTGKPYRLIDKGEEK